MEQQNPVSQGFLIIEASRSYSDTLQSVGVISPAQRPLPDNTQPFKRQISMLPVGFKPAIRAGEQLQTHGLNRAVTGIGTSVLLNAINLHSVYVDIHVRNVAISTLLSTVVTLQMALQGPKYDEAVI
jgi:hypothetical protein